MVKYAFTKWEDNSTNPTRTITTTADMTITATYSIVTRRITFQSQPIAIQAVVNGQPLNAGQSIDLPEGTQVTIVVPSEVSA